MTTPDDSVNRSTFNEANLLEKVDVNLRGAPTATPFVTNIDYDAKGQRTSDRLRQRRQHTVRVRPADLPPDPSAHHTRRGSWRRIQPANPPADVQNLSYTYDPAGQHHPHPGRRPADHLFPQQQVEPSADYTYDAVYRLIAASGREHLGQASGGGAAWRLSR